MKMTSRTLPRLQERADQRPFANVAETPTRLPRACRKRKLDHSKISDDDDSDAESDESLTKKNKGADSYTGAASDNYPSSTPSPAAPLPSPSSLTISESEYLFVEADSEPAKIFRGFPVEVHQNIIRFLHTDRQVLRYGQICKETLGAVSNSVWRERLENTFDVTPRDETINDKRGKSTVIPWSTCAAQLYQARQMETKCWVTFNGKLAGSNPDSNLRKVQYIHQENFLLHLRDMIFESNAKKIANDGKTMIVGKNLEYIRAMTSNPQERKYVNVLDSLLEEDFTMPPKCARLSPKIKAATLAMVQLCLSPIILDPKCCTTPVFRFDVSQKLVYSSAKFPLFKGKYKSQINIKLLLNTLNFFKFHFKARNGEGLLSDAYARLDETQLPQMWAGEIPMGTQPLTGHWKGATTFLDPRELELLRGKYTDEGIFSDIVDDENNFMDITFFHDEKMFGTARWPVAWDVILGSDPYAESDSPNNGSQKKKKKGDNPMKRPDVKAFWGTSRGLRNGHMFGRIHSVNNQGDFHGWQRVTMLKVFAASDGAYSPDQVWVYEGVVLPGGRLIIGRWSHPFGDPENPDESDSGPFIFWNVDRSDANPPIDPEEAWRFCEEIEDPLFSQLFV